MPANNMPPDWVPAAPAWQSRWPAGQEALVAAYFGIQADRPAALSDWAGRAFSHAFAPSLVERGRYVDGHGIENFLYVGYWPCSRYFAWWRDPEVSGWWANERRTEEGAGYWREVFTMPPDHLETLHSTTCPYGIGTLAEDVEGPILEHGYPGGMRDRITLSDSDDLRAMVDMGQRLAAEAGSDGARVRLTPPCKMAVIRSGQNWGYCGAEERSYYLQQVHPVLLEGMAYLRDNPVESGCYSLRMVTQTDEHWEPLDQSFGLGYTVDIHALEGWAKSHPTHVAIFDSFLKMADRFGEGMQLRLWHEVSVLPDAGCECEYIGCHAQTGLLPYI